MENKIQKTISKLISLSLLILLVSCSTTYKNKVIADEGIVEQPIRWIVTPYPEIYCSKLHPEGCVLLNRDVCTIVAQKPKSFLDHRRLEVIGHEVWHCFHGPIHD